MKLGTQITALAVLASVATAALSPAALADNRQKNKNGWRNMAGIGAAVAGYGLLKGNKTATVLGAAGAAYSANRYEKDRHSQSEIKANRARYHARQSYHRRTGRYLRHY